MASLHCCGLPLQRIHGCRRRSFSSDNKINVFFHRECTNAPLAHFSFRFENAGRLRGLQRTVRVFSSNTSPSEGSDGAKRSDNDNAKGPPFLTILAGLFVLFVISWIIGSIVMWLVSLIINPPSK